MKILKRFVLIVLFAHSFIMLSCDDNDNQPAGEFENGIFVINEGNFLDADGTVSFIDPDDGTVELDLFGTVNNGLALGDVVQSMTIDGEFSYVVVNNSNKIEVVKANTFEAVHTIDGLSLPRYLTSMDGTGYVTEWVSFADPGRVTKIDLEDHTAGGSINVGYGAENILAHDGLLYVSNSFENTVSVVDPEAGEVVKTIEVGSSPGMILLDKDEMIWVVCGGGFDFDYNPLNDGKIVKVDPSKSNDESAESVVLEVELGTNLAAKAAINGQKDRIFYFVGKSVYVVDVSAAAEPTTALFTEANATSFYGIGVDPENDILYLADSKNFVGNGVVFRYSLSGQPIDNKGVGRAPNGFIFK